MSWRIIPRKSKIVRILRSRFKEVGDDEVFNHRKNKCLYCKHNSKNGGKVTWLGRILIFLSNFYTAVTLSKSEDLGNCTACGCDVFYKSKEKDEDCPKGYW